ncbi:MAG: YcgN family cysteine cluster protein [endosymbiont of Galathealinum brachiosum]|uniref:UPF0260 protein DIZ80_04860 n=1 Tax=endosymbiont of Galathealinum brachiosum TaxID=2200906 RepID=A0A370DIP7_9GAMM|nr:MAG: YcgN family cysteine cluster protein [endosymbiont of Galathealinum brachiosum]
MKKPFWVEKSLKEMTDQQWESLCDGCARCCLLKLEDEDSGELHFTRASCRLLDIETCRCKDYSNRKFREPECLAVRQMELEEYRWLPQTCAYRLISEGKELPEWHPLISGDNNSVKQAGISVEGFALSEEYIHPDQLDELIVELDTMIK